MGDDDQKFTEEAIQRVVSPLAVLLVGIAGQIQWIVKDRPSVDSDEIGSMIRSIMESDRRMCGKNFPAYAKDQRSVSPGAGQALSEDEQYAEEFATCQRNMVHGARVTLQECLPVLREHAVRLQAKGRLNEPDAGCRFAVRRA